MTDDFLKLSNTLKQKILLHRRVQDVIESSGLDASDKSNTISLHLSATKESFNKLVRKKKALHTNYVFCESEYERDHVVPLDLIFMYALNENPSIEHIAKVLERNLVTIQIHKSDHAVLNKRFKFNMPGVNSPKDILFCDTLARYKETFPEIYCSLKESENNRLNFLYTKNVLGNF